ncbi:MAG: cyclic nucleotide-binding domain-containing protein [Deltaproteobacteria bacterium]|nr:MAG: cyclic nucleotide-binding domain-containing protein [Deltaproteobacteria bacterium]
MTSPDLFARIVADLTEDDADLLRERFVRRAIDAGQVLVREGDFADTLFLVERGKLQVTVGGYGESPFDVEVDTMGAGAWIGEVALLDPGPATATVLAREPTVVHALSYVEFHRLTEQEPATARKLLRSLAVELAGRLRARSNELLTWEGDMPELHEAPKARGWLSRLFSGLLGADS